MKSDIHLEGNLLEIRSGAHSSLFSEDGELWDGTEGSLGTVEIGRLSDKRDQGNERGNGVVPRRG